LGCNGQRIAATFMSQICKGNGQNVPALVNPRDQHLEDVELCKPMIELIQKEVNPQLDLILYKNATVGCLHPSQLELEPDLEWKEAARVRQY
jgi:hypothetical protein